MQLDATASRALDLPLPFHFFQFLQGTRPITFQEPGECPICKQLAPRLALRAVVGFTLGVDDPLHRRAALGTGLALATVNRHPFPKRSDTLRESIPDLHTQPLDPLPEHTLSGLV